MGCVDESDWDVWVEGNTVVVELQRRLVLDDRASERLYDAIETAVGGDVERVLTIVDIEHPLSDALHEAVVRGARTAAASGVTDWHVVAEHEHKAIAVARELPGVETAVFADEREARARAT
jgi:hypothetical protein